MTLDSLTFPVITFGKDGSVLSYPDKMSLTECPRQALTNGYFVGLEIIDSHGQIVTVQKVQQIEHSHNIAQSVKGFFAQSVRVGFILEDKAPDFILLNDLKAKANACLETWCDDDAGEETRQMVAEASSYETVIRLFSNKPWSDE